jgi:hypothetical protein
MIAVNARTDLRVMSCSFFCGTPFATSKLWKRTEGRRRFPMARCMSATEHKTVRHVLVPRPTITCLRMLSAPRSPVRERAIRLMIKESGRLAPAENGAVCLAHLAIRS